MNHLIVGAGPAGIIAAETLRRTDSDCTITVVGDEPETPYSRMALPYLLAGQVGDAGTYLRRAPGHFEAQRIRIEAAHVAAVDVEAHTAQLTNGELLPWDRLLVATGSRTIRPPIEGADLPGVENCWTLADARRIAARAQAGTRVVLLGAGFIGCIVLEALVARGVTLTVIEMADRMLARMMDEAGAEMIKRWCEGRGVKVMTASRVEAIEQIELGLRLQVAGATPVEADLIVCATGVRPNVDFLQGTAVEVDAGVLVDRRLASSVDGIFAAGDVAQGPDFSTGERQVHAIQPTASEHGRIAALSMAGRSTGFQGSLSMNVLNTMGLISSAFGLWMGVDGGHTSVASDPDRFRYLRLEFDGDRLVGAIALGLTNHVGVLRGLIQTRVALGPWRARLLASPHLIMEAYLERTQGQAQLAAGA